MRCKELLQGKKTGQYEQTVDVLMDSLVKGEKGRAVYKHISLQQEIVFCDLIRKCDYIQKKG